MKTGERGLLKVINRVNDLCFIFKETGLKLTNRVRFLILTLALRLIKLVI